MDVRTVDALRPKYPLGKLIAEGKTKKVFEVDGKPSLVVMAAKDDITAGDGAKHDVIPEKGKLATQTTCNVFWLLRACGLPVAFVEQDSPTSFVAQHCDMFPYEVVIRREGHGSFIKRNPHLAKGHLFSKLILEFFLKTSGKRWKEYELPCDDPLIYDPTGGRGFIALYRPDMPLHQQEPIHIISEKEIFPIDLDAVTFMGKTAAQALLVLEKAWQLAGRTLVDFKVEFGIDGAGNLLLADVIDNDSWRVLENGLYIDKQVYRDGGTLGEVAEKYRRVAELTDGFGLPRQQIILWRGSATDSFDPFKPDDLRKELGSFVWVEEVTCSAHRQPVRAFEELAERVQQVPDSVIVAYAGRSNGLGPTLAANTNVPVITLSPSFKDFPDDIWSSLRTPTGVPALTVLEAGNAISAAKRILSVRNPHLYAQVRGEIEQRMMNFVEI